jgi:hypothetical protein
METKRNTNNIKKKRIRKKPEDGKASDFHHSSFRFEKENKQKIVQNAR